MGINVRTCSGKRARFCNMHTVCVGVLGRCLYYEGRGNVLSGFSGTEYIKELRYSGGVLNKLSLSAVF